MKKYILVLTICLLSLTSFAQEKYFTRTGHVSFYSDTPVEKIEAHNYQVTSVLNATNGNIDFSILIKSFEFEKALMQEHFNENYLESDEFPKASFKGIVNEFNKVDLKKDGTYPVEVEGDLTIHGVTKKVKTKGTIEVKGTQVNAKAEFNVALKDYNVSIPKVNQTQVAEVVKVKADIKYQPYTKGKN